MILFLPWVLVLVVSSRVLSITGHGFCYGSLILDVCSQPWGASVLLCLSVTFKKFLDYIAEIIIRQKFLIENHRCMVRTINHWSFDLSALQSKFKPSELNVLLSCKSKLLKDPDLITALIIRILQLYVLSLQGGNLNASWYAYFR